MMNIIEKTDEEILEIADPMWADLVKYSNEQNYGAFTRNFAALSIEQRPHTINYEKKDQQTICRSFFKDK